MTIMIPSSCLGAFRKQQQQYVKNTVKSLAKKKNVRLLSLRGASTRTSSNNNRSSNGQSSSDILTAVAVTALMSLSMIPSSSSSQQNNDTNNNTLSITNSRICQCDSSISANPHPLYQMNQQDSSSTSNNSNNNIKSDSNSNNPSSEKLSNQPRNVMLHRLRSLRGRNLNEKYNVDWKTVLGEGAYGSVHPARLAATGEKVALKKIAKRYTNNDVFSRETDALLRIYNNGGHPNISGLRDMYEDYDHYYLVMDLVSGGEMFDHLIKYGAYSEADAARLMREVASSLAFLHGIGVVHSDLKPENLLLCSKKREDGTVKLIDFGCAVVQKDNTFDDVEQHNNEDSSSQSQSRSSNWIEEFQENNVNVLQNEQKELQYTGTTAYWPPERFLNLRSPPNAAADMWAVGIILFIMLTGVHPFDLTGVATDAEIEEQIKRDPSPPITPALTSHLSPAAIDLLKKLFAKDPKGRLTADEMLMHPWIGGDEATTEVMEKSAQKLSKYKDLRAVIEAGIFSILIEQGSKEMLLSEYTPNLVYKSDRRESGDKAVVPATSILKRAFEAFDEEGKGFVSADDLGRVLSQRTGQQFSEKEKKELMKFTDRLASDGNVSGQSSGLSLSSFSNVFAGLKHKHYPRGHIIFHAGDEGDCMYFINSGKVEIQTRKGQLVHILRHGDFFGEGSLLEDDNIRFSSAKCATPVDVIKIKRSDFEKYIKNSKSAKNALKSRWNTRLLADAKALIRLQTNVKAKMYRQGDIVYKEGDMGDSMFIVDEERGGELDVKHGNVTVHKYRKGETFGESSLLMGRPRSSTVICSSETCFLHEMMKKDFMDFVDSSSETKAMLLNMCRKRLFKKAVKAYSLTHKRGFSNEDLTKAFVEADLDKSGDLGLDEVTKLMHAMDPTIEKKDIEELMKFIDVDEDGKLSYEDFKRLFRSFTFESYDQAYPTKS